MTRVYTDYRNQLPWSNRAKRVAWGVAWSLLFRPSPTCLFRWRALLVSMFGGKIAPGVRLYPSVRIWAPWNLVMEAGSTLADGVDCYSVDRIEIGPEVTVSQRTFLCTASHDLAARERTLTTRPIRLMRASWVFAEAFVGPGVTVGEGAVVAARAVVVRDVDKWTIVGGNPARLLKRRIMRTAGGGDGDPKS